MDVKYTKYITVYKRIIIKVNTSTVYCWLILHLPSVMFHVIIVFSPPNIHGQCKGGGEYFCLNTQHSTYADGHMHVLSE